VTIIVGKKNYNKGREIVLPIVLAQYLSDTFLSLRRASSLRRCEKHSDEAISVDLVGNERLPRPDKSGLAMTWKVIIQCCKHIIKCH